MRRHTALGVVAELLPIEVVHLRTARMRMPVPAFDALVTELAHPPVAVEHVRPDTAPPASAPVRPPRAHSISVTVNSM